MADLRGLRVLRGPHWDQEDTDGGEGYLGTVTQSLGNHQVRVHWDMGQESACSTGRGGSFHLRVFDSAPLGIHHSGTKCSACGEEIKGTLWRCQDFAGCDLCSLCYGDDKHDIRHQFLRFDTSSAAGRPMPRRKSSVKIRTIGLHPGAKVVRGKDWEWGNQDGGEGSEGEVQGYEDAPDAPRSMVHVKWTGGAEYRYRLGVRGKVDLTCVEEEVGPFYYRDHLPLLDTTETSKLTMKDSSKPITSESVIESTPPDSPGIQTLSLTSAAGTTTVRGESVIGRTTSGNVAEDEKLTEGDHVAIKVDEAELQELQKDSGGCTARMLRCIGRTGEVTDILAKGVVSVKFGGSAAKVSYRFNPRTLMKVSANFSENDVVRVRDNVKLLKVLNRRLKWTSPMDRTVNKVGRVVRVDEDGDLRVDFQGERLMYAPACCVPAPGCVPESLGSATGSWATSEIGNALDGQQEEGDHLAVFRKVRDLVQNEGRRSQGRSTRAMFAAIDMGDAQSVRDMCQEDPSMIEREHQGITPLIFASLRAKRNCMLTLMDLGADPSKAASDDSRKTPLSAVSEGKSDEVAELLLSRGADTRHLYGDGHTLAHLCVIRNKTIIMQALVQHGADLNIKDDDEDTALHLAIKLRRHEVMEVLVDVPQVNIHIGNRGDFDMIQLAAYVDNTRAMERLLTRDSSQVEKLRKGHSTALHIAATNDHMDCVRLLVLQGGADVNARQTKTDSTALLIACHKAKLQTVEALLELGADVNVCDSDGDTALHLAIGGKVEGYGKSEHAELVVAYRVQIANLLISSGAYADAQNQKGRTAFSYGRTAVRDGVQAFVKHNRDIVRLKRAGRMDSVLQSLGVSSAVSQGRGHLKEVLRGISLPCGLCGRPKSDVTLKPCGHKCVCKTCSVKVTMCPLCDEEVKEKDCAD